MQTGILAEHKAARILYAPTVLSCALFGHPPFIGGDEVDWREIEVIHDEWNRPAIALHGRVAAACEESLGPSSSWKVLVSISHDGACAIAQVAIVDVTA